MCKIYISVMRTCSVLEKWDTFRPLTCHKGLNGAPLGCQNVKNEGKLMRAATKSILLCTICKIYMSVMRTYSALDKWGTVGLTTCQKGLNGAPLGCQNI